MRIQQYILNKQTIFIYNTEKLCVHLHPLTPITGWDVF